jgi:hypothetical protein
MSQIITSVPATCPERSDFVDGNNCSSLTELQTVRPTPCMTLRYDVLEIEPFVPNAPLPRQVLDLVLSPSSSALTASDVKATARATQQVEVGRTWRILEIEVNLGGISPQPLQT